MNGKLVVKDGKVDMKNLSMSTMGGNVVMNGYYSTANAKKPEMKAGFKLTNLSFSQAYKELDMVQQLAPIFESLKGNFSGSINVLTDLDATMSPVLDTMQGDGSLSTRDLSLSGVKAIDQIADAIKQPSLKEMKVKDMTLDFTIKDGRVETQPFDIKMGDYNLNLSGSTGLDQPIDYTGKIITPGLVDLHLHAPQYSYCGTAMDLELLDWLQQYTYPEEAHYADPAYARLGYSYFVRDLKNSATTRACIFATLHTDATLELMHQLRGAGLSAFVGKLGMDRNSPDSYREPSAAAGLAETRRWLDTCRAENTLHAGPVRPMITPRFTPSTSDEYMRGLGELAREYNVPAQSHLSENPGEIAWVAELCPGTKFYGESYSRYGLFGGGVPTVMAHCIYSPDDEAALMKQNRVMIAHCPTSNENVIAGIAPAAHYLRGGWRVGLGSDVAGGQTLDLFTVMATAVQVSKLRWRYIDQSEKPLTMVEALYMATVGGGDFWADFGEKVGLFEDGYAFDALVLDDDPLKNMRAFSAAERLERYAYLGKGKLTAKFAAGEKLL